MFVIATTSVTTMNLKQYLSFLESRFLLYFAIGILALTIIWVFEASEGEVDALTSYVVKVVRFNKLLGHVLNNDLDFQSRTSMSRGAFDNVRWGMQRDPQSVRPRK